jgi:hypothetical protein
MKSLQIDSGLLAMPQKLRQLVLTTCVSASPYNHRYVGSGSYYNTTDKDWDCTPDGCLRVSDHWNFWSKGTLHCKANMPNEELDGKWALGKYSKESGIYTILEVFEKDYEAISKRKKRKDSLVIDPLQTRRENRRRVLDEKRYTAKKARREQKIKAGNQWVCFTVNQWSGTGRRKRFAGLKFVFGKLVYESGCKKIVESTSGTKTEYRAYQGYREFDRKPGKTQLKNYGI